MEKEKVSLVGLGPGNTDFLSVSAKDKILSADLIIGARRILGSVKPFLKNEAEILESHDTEKIVARIKNFLNSGGFSKSVCVVFSGDTGFYSGSTALSARLSEEKIDFRIFHALSSVQYFSAKIGKSWQDWNLVSLHGCERNFTAEIMSSRQTFFLLGGKTTVQDIEKTLSERGFSGKLTAGKDLSLESEKIFSVTMELGEPDARFPADFSESSLVVLLSENAAFRANLKPPLMDEDFIREDGVPMTKRLVRATVLALLSVTDSEIVWDVGAGTGAVSVDIALSSKCSVYSIEEKESAVEAEKKNRKKFCALNMSIIHGKAPAALSFLPAPNVVFVGGSGGNLDAIVSIALEKNPSARILVPCVTIETLSECKKISEEKNISIDVTQISVASTSKIGKYNMMRAENPVWLVRFGI